METWTEGPDTITPPDLATELGHNDGKRPGRKIRKWLRAHYPRNEEKGALWHIPPHVADRIRTYSPIRGLTAA